MRRALRLPVEALSPYFFEVAMPRGPQALAQQTLNVVPWSQIFDNDRPVEIEIDFGKGLFLMNAGEARPQTNFFGIEIERKYTLLTATRLYRRGIANVKVACCDARWLLTTHVAAGSVSAVHVYFPDPWWKNRHRKRRLFTPEFAAQVERVLEPGGSLHFVSDVEAYFNESVQMLHELPRLAPLPAPSVKVPEHDLDYLTNFERKYRKEGRPIYRGEWRKEL